MKFPNPLGRAGLRGRTFLLAWLVTLVTLATFVGVTVPDQRRDLLDGVAAKAQGLCSSLQQATAAAAVSEDFSSVVEQSLQVLAVDPDIEFIMISRRDGMSVQVTRTGWRVEPRDSSGLPDERGDARGHIIRWQGRRLFHYSQPFTYNVIRWGRVHVGLSLNAFDASVRRIYLRTVLLSLACMVISLLASIVYAHKLVGPILTLKRVVGQLARGDLSARAAIVGRDELASLGRSFNLMADSLGQRNRILVSLRACAERLLAVREWRQVLPGVLASLGEAAGAASVWVAVEDGAGGWRKEAVWGAPGRAEEPVAPLPADGFRDWPAMERLLCGGETVQAVWQPAERDRPVPLSLAPLQAGVGRLGYVGASRGDGQPWGEVERECFQAAAGVLGVAMARQRARAALIEANEKLEGRVLERTAALREEVAAKQRALAELAETQQRLVELSRLSGMAEVASGVLHNVGNVLNSVTVSTSLMAARLRHSRVERLAQLAGVARDAPDLAQFLTADQGGRNWLPYLEQLGGHLCAERDELLAEARRLEENVGHIRAIVATQQEYAKAVGVRESASLRGLVEDAARIAGPDLARAGARFEHLQEGDRVVNVERHVLLQILVNLLRNAAQAVAASPQACVRVQCGEDGSGGVRIAVVDNGVGLAAEELTRIFAHGYTTKKDGHGFGLHSGALGARRLGGRLWAESAGPGRGAEFILELPLEAVVEAA